MGHSRDEMPRNPNTGLTTVHFFSLKSLIIFPTSVLLVVYPGLLGRTVPSILFIFFHEKCCIYEAAWPDRVQEWEKHKPPVCLSFCPAKNMDFPPKPLKIMLVKMRFSCSGGSKALFMLFILWLHHATYVHLGQQLCEVQGKHFFFYI